MEYFTQTNQDALLQSAGSTITTGVPIPQVELPNVGDKMLVQFNPWGGIILVNPKHPPTDAKIFEVEITSEKQIQINIV